MGWSDLTRLNLSAGLASVSVAAVLVVVKLWALGQTGSLSVAARVAFSTRAPYLLRVTTPTAWPVRVARPWIASSRSGRSS